MELAVTWVVGAIGFVVAGAVFCLSFYLLEKIDVLISLGKVLETLYLWAMICIIAVGVPLLLGEALLELLQ